MRIIRREFSKITFRSFLIFFQVNLCFGAFTEPGVGRDSQASPGPVFTASRYFFTELHTSKSPFKAQPKIINRKSEKIVILFFNKVIVYKIKFNVAPTINAVTVIINIAFIIPAKPSSFNSMMNVATHGK